MSANKSDLLASIGFAGNRSAVVMLVLTSLIAILAFTAGPSVSMAQIVEQRGFVHKSHGSNKIKKGNRSRSDAFGPRGEQSWSAASLARPTAVGTVVPYAAR